VREWILNSTSAQLGYTVQFTLVYAQKYRTNNKFKKTESTQTKHNRKSKQRKIHCVQKKTPTHIFFYIPMSDV